MLVTVAPYESISAVGATREQRAGQSPNESGQSTAGTGGGPGLVRLPVSGVLGSQPHGSFQANRLCRRRLRRRAHRVPSAEAAASGQSGSRWFAQHAAKQSAAPSADTNDIDPT
jgi:hypothetical protein